MGSAPLLLMLVLMIGFLFFSFRKQKKQMSQTQDMQNSLSVGDRIMTTTGLFGTVVGLDDENFELEIAPGVTTTWLRRAVAKVIVEDYDAPEIETIDDAPVEDRVDFDKPEKKDD